MEAILNELEAILNEERAVYMRLLAVACAMNEALKRESVHEVSAANKEYDELTVAIYGLEEKRLLKSDEIARQYGLAHHVNLLRIIDVILPPDKNRMLDLRNSLRAAISELQKKNISNRVLITEALFAITKTFELVAFTSRKITGYKQKGNKDFSRLGQAMINAVV